MSTITKTYKICDKCKKEIRGRLITHKCPCCGLDVCNECQEAEDAKPAKKKEMPVLPDKKIRKRERKIEDALVDSALSIHVPTGEGKDTKYKVRILDSYAEGDTLEGKTLKSTVSAALIPWQGEIPTPFLIEQYIKTLTGILEAE